MRRGTQVAKVLDKGNVNFDDESVEFGFVVSEEGDSHFVRYWRKGMPGILRTRANSELTKNENLVEHISIDPDTVIDTLLDIGYIISNEDQRVLFEAARTGNRRESRS